MLHRTMGEFTCRTELIGDVEGSSRHITGFAWGTTVNRGAGGGKEDVNESLPQSLVI